MASDPPKNDAKLWPYSFTQVGELRTEIEIGAMKNE